MSLLPTVYHDFLLLVSFDEFCGFLSKSAQEGDGSCSRNFCMVFLFFFISTQLIEVLSRKRKCMYIQINNDSRSVFLFLTPRSPQKTPATLHFVVGQF